MENIAKPNEPWKTLKSLGLSNKKFTNKYMCQK